MKTPLQADESGHGIIAGIVIVVVVALIGFTGWRVYEHRKQQSKTSTSTTTAAAPQSTGTSNADLQSDLNGVDSAMNQATQDGNAASNALNDSQNEISIPTN